jgi:hypothetical protein
MRERGATTTDGPMCGGRKGQEEHRAQEETKVLFFFSSKSCPAEGRCRVALADINVQSTLLGIREEAMKEHD